MTVRHRLSELTAPGPFPHDVDPARREDWLSDVDFVSALGVERHAFAAKPAWWRKQQKEKVGLF